MRNIKENLKRMNSEYCSGLDKEAIAAANEIHEYAIEYPSNVAKAITENYKNVKKDSARLDWILSQLDYDVKMNLGITGTRESIDKMMA